MNNSYHWQKQQAQERIENYRHQAQVHRQTKDPRSVDKENSLAFSKVSFAIAISISLVAIIFLMSS